MPLFRSMGRTMATTDHRLPITPTEASTGVIIAPFAEDDGKAVHLAHELGTMIGERLMPSVSAEPISNFEISGAMLEVADLLESQQANPFRVSSYHKGAQALTELPKSAVDILETEGFQALMELPGIWRSLAVSIERLIQSGRLPLLVMNPS